MPRPVKGKVGVFLYIDEKIWTEFKELAKQKHPEMYGLSCEAEEAFRNWLRLHTQMHTKTLMMNKINPSPRAFQVHRQIKQYLRERFGYLIFQQVPRKHIVEAISAVRGGDPRTVKRWMSELMHYKLIKYIAGELFEIV